jgi:hypothetical protein
VAIGHLVTRSRQVAKHQSVIRKTVVNQRFKISGVLHPVCDAPPDDRNMVARLELEQRLGADRHG